MSKENKKQKYGVTQRQAMEGSENPTSKINTGLPESRMQGNVQTMSSTDSVTPASSVVSSGDAVTLAAQSIENIHKKVKIKPSANVTLNTKTQPGGVPIGDGNAVSYSAAGVTSAPVSVEDSSRIPYTAGGYRPNPYIAKKTSDNDFLINNAISEQPVPEFEGSKDLRGNPGSYQGYNGVKQFKTARGKKNAGTVPQSTLYDRSADFVFIDSTVHTTGQVLDDIEVQAGYPTKKALNNLALDEETGYEAVPVNTPKSNYLLKTFSFTLTDGKISAVSFNEDMIPGQINSSNSLQANLNWKIDRNNVAKTMIKLQKELGRETTEKWSPLGYVIHQPYEYNMLAHDIEAVTGAMMMTAYRCANTSLAYQSHNKLGKDGAKPQTPILEMFLGGIGRLGKSIPGDFGLTNYNSFIFSTDFCKAGSASAIIKMFDSTTKYTTKANFFNLPRSLKYFIQTCDNNLNPLHAKKQFLEALDTAHVYSTVDGEYNPMLPIYATDKISLVNPMSLNSFLYGWDRDNVTSENPSGTATIYSYKYGDIRNTYVWDIKHPLVEGLLTWMIKNEPALVKAYGTNATVEIPAFFSCLAPSMFQSMLCAASQEVLWARNIYFRDFLFAGEQTEYIWDDLTSLKDLNPKYSSNFTCDDFREPIKMGTMKPASFVHLLWGEHYTVAGSANAGFDEVTYFMPWYHNETCFDNQYTTALGFYKDSEDAYGMSYPEVRIGVCHEYVDKVFSISERDMRLSLDRAIGVPINVVSAEEDGITKYYRDEDLTNSVISSKVKLGSIRYDKNSDGRVMAQYSNTTGIQVVPNKASVMCLPRELGYLYPHFRVSPILSVTALTSDSISISYVGSYRMSDKLDGSMSFSIASYHAIGNGIDSTTISRTAALQQDYISFFADRTSEVVTMNEEYTSEIGILPCVSGLFNNESDAETLSVKADNVLVPFFTLNGTNIKNDFAGTPNIFTLARYTWTALNRVFFPINYFENCLIASGASEEIEANKGALVDPFEGSYCFGLSGFFRSDFSQDVLNRADLYDQLHIDYTEDVFIKDSLIFRKD